MIAAPLALVAENDPSTQKLLNVLLERRAMTVDAVSSGAEAFMLARHVAYDVIVLDLMLPDTTGFEILEMLAVTRPAALHRVIVVSSAGKAKLEHVRDRYPQVVVIRKPFELADFFEVVARVDRPSGEHASPLRDFTRQSIRYGAKAGLLTSREGAGLRIQHAFGYEQAWLDEFKTIDMHQQLPLAISARHERPVWLSSVRLAAPDYPLLVPIWEAEKTRSLAVVPIRRDTTVIGVAGWSFGNPRTFDEQEQRALSALAADAEPLLDDLGHAVSA